MKTISALLSVIFLFILSASINAQLKIITDGNVGIGIDNPLEKLHINGSIRGNQLNGSLRIATLGSGNIDIGPQNTSFAHIRTNLSRFYFDKKIILGDGKISTYNTGNMLLCTGHSNEITRLTISGTTGNVGIGLTPGTVYKLEVLGSIGSTGFIITSDVRLKDNVRNMDKTYNKIALLQPITYQYKDRLVKPGEAAVDSTGAIISAKPLEGPLDKKTHYGFSAQDVQKIFPDLVIENDDGYLSLDYIGLIPVLVEALKEQQLKIEALEKKVAELAGAKLIK